MILNYVFILAAVASQRLQDELLLSARHTVFLVTVLADSQFIHVCHLGLGSAVATFELGLLVESDFNGTSGDIEGFSLLSDLLHGLVTMGSQL